MIVKKIFTKVILKVYLSFISPWSLICNCGVWSLFDCELTVPTDYLMKYLTESSAYILSVNEKLPVLKFRYFGKYKIQLFGYCYVHVSGQRQAGLER